ncbi:hypothetical protein ACHWQZ_G003569 [Mnemiopsis leidyi]
MDNMSGFCYTTENKAFPGVGVFLLCIPPIISCLFIVAMLIVLLYQYLLQRKAKDTLHSDETKLIIILIYTTIFVLCEGPIWLIYFLYNSEEGIKWIRDGNELNNYYVGLFYHQYVSSVLRDDFDYKGQNLYMALRYYPKYVQLTLTIETLIQTMTLLFVQHEILEWLHKVATNRNFVRSFYRKSGEI